MAVLVIKISTYDYGKNKGYTTDWSTTFATGRGLSPRQEPRIPHALSHNRAESHIYTEGDVSYGWQFRCEDIHILSERGLKLSIFCMADRNNKYEGFSTTENMKVNKVADFIARLSLRIRKDSFIVLDNASVHRCKLMRELRPIWEKQGLFLFFLPPYSPHLNIVEMLWRILKDKRLRPIDYVSTDSLLYATNRALVAIGTKLKINFAHVA